MTLIRFATADERLAASERIERDAWLDLYVAAQEKAGDALQATSVLQGGAALTAMRAINWGLFNRAQGLGCEGPFSEVDAAAAIAWLQRHCAPDWRFQLVPASLPPDFQSRAAELGLSPKGRGPARLYRDAAPLPAVDQASDARFRIEQVTAADARDCVDVVKVAYGFPPAVIDWIVGVVGREGWRAYAAFDEGRPIAFGLMFTKGEWAWLGWGTTLADHRGKGAQSALVRRRVADGLAQGIEHFATECAAPSDGDPGASVSYRNMIRAGFSEAYIRTAYGPA